MVELLENFNDLVWWLAAVQVLEIAQAEAIIRRWGDTAEGEHTLERARAFRLVLREMVKQIIAGKEVPPAVIEEVNKLLRYRIRYSELLQVQNRFTTRSSVEFDEVMQLLTPIAEGVSDLLCQADFSLIKKCENPACILYFYDTSKNRVRRWCSMNTCGNRMKAAAYYRRHRAAPELIEGQPALRH